MRTSVAVALGSNLGDRAAYLHFAIARLAQLLTGLRVSSFYDTDPLGGPPDAPRYLNAVAVGETSLGARALLDALLAIEGAAGRDRPFQDAPRTLDLDLVLYGDAVIDEPGLQVPHPRFRQRGFVLEPLAELAGDWMDPVTGRTIGGLYAAMRGQLR